MADASTLSIVFGYRNREIGRVKRCLESLTQQTSTDFEVLFVDYGSDSNIAVEIRSLVAQFPFVTYCYSDTRGYPWNRSKALNIGIRLAKGEYILTTDIDLIFAPNFMAACQEHARPNRVLHIKPYMLPQGFTDWDNLSNYVNRLPTGGQAMLGACQLAAASPWKQCRGFDEFYRYYGVEDRDLEARFAQMAIEPFWLTNYTQVFHQWHPPATYLSKGIMPTDVWTRMQLHLYLHKKSLERNDDNWGTIIPMDTRAIFRFVDIQQNTVVPQSDLQYVAVNPYSTQSVAKMIAVFFELPSGNALAVAGAGLPQRQRWLDSVIYRSNNWFDRLGIPTHIDYCPNLLHDSLVYLIEQGTEHVADYYLNMGGISVLVKA